MLAVASRLCGLHAQVLSSAELTLWARVQGLERGDLGRALWDDHTLVKTWAMRGTLHLLPASELPLWHAALGVSRRYRSPAGWKRVFGITLEELDQLTEAIGQALHGQVLTREELVREVGRLTGLASLAAKIAEGTWGSILKPAAFAGHLCFAPSLGQRVRFTRPATWTAANPGRSGPVIDSETAHTEIARRYLAAYAPATVHDLARWWGGAVAAARQWIASLGEEAISVHVEGEQSWMLAKHVREISDLPAARSVRLLPAFDQYVVVASRHATHLLTGAPRNRVYRPQGWISPVLLVNGLMKGVWQHKVRGSRLEVVIEFASLRREKLDPFVRVPAWVRRGAGEEAEHLAAFLGHPLNVVWKIQERG